MNPAHAYKMNGWMYTYTQLNWGTDEWSDSLMNGWINRLNGWII